VHSSYRFAGYFGNHCNSDCHCCQVFLRYVLFSGILASLSYLRLHCCLTFSALTLTGAVDMLICAIERNGIRSVKSPSPTDFCESVWPNLQAVVTPVKSRWKVVVFGVVMQW